jgi:hypothetical protein
MKTIKLLILIIIISGLNVTAQVAISTDGSTADASAMLEVKSSNKGFLPPRMTETQRDAISNPVAGLSVWCSDCGDNGEMQVYNGSDWTNMIGGEAAAAAEAVPNVTNPTTGKTWMDRNLGASQVATSSTDAAAYGDLYQWGRGSDGHESRSSGTTSTLSNSDSPGHGDFIIPLDSPFDWRSSQNDNLWQGVSGTNNPCPSGYRPPTESEWVAERQSWSNDNADGAFASPLKLPVAGYRDGSDGSLINVGSGGSYWSNTTDGANSPYLYFGSNYAGIVPIYRALGLSVRCIKD